ncbi:UDP-N-acetylmuramate dehydrogenase [Lacibacterium aquatile]|uniref:UDP-N-acetylenolpyruvoylglucosamine reductase n=1 Tax=Lacibacterium aquatile TaxID=1168082 RepID=A0ABW5DWE5_9PROT
MMAVSPDILNNLPPLKGRLSTDASLATITWFGVGGPCDLMFRPADAEDLASFLKHLPAEVPVTVIGVGSNLLVRDGGVKGVVIRLGRGFVDIKAEGEDVIAGASALDANVAQVAADAGIGGMEFLSGVPGTIGGALKMNAGAYGGDMKQIVVSATAVDRQGNLHTVSAEQLGFTYRHSETPEGWIFTGARLRGIAGNPVEISAKLANIKQNRENAQPIRAKTGGSTFKNPTGHSAWELVDRAGCRGLRMGGAQVSEKHTNFLINTGGATAAEIEALGEEVRRRVLDLTGITLEWEIKRIGEAANG